MGKIIKIYISAAVFLVFVSLCNGGQDEEIYSENQSGDTETEGVRTANFENNEDQSSCFDLTQGQCAADKDVITSTADDIKQDFDHSISSLKPEEQEVLEKPVHCSSSSCPSTEAPMSVLNSESSELHSSDHEFEINSFRQFIDQKFPILGKKYCVSKNNTNQSMKADEPSMSNGTDSEGNPSAKGPNATINKQVVCNQTEIQELYNVEIITATTLLKVLQTDLNITGRSVEANCVLLYFFSPYCPFSCRGSPYVNALARSVPNIPVYGLDSVEHHSVNSRYGVMGTPSLLLFHNGNVVGRYNASEFSTLLLMSFIHHYTDQNITYINVTSDDFKADLPSQVVVSVPYALYSAWGFLIIYALWFFMTSQLYARLSEAFLNNWREAEAQQVHVHED